MKTGNSHSNSTAAQTMRVLLALRVSPKSTIELRRDSDVLMPAARIHQLRVMGHQIVTQWTQEASECGRLHRIAKYVLTTPAKVPQ